jgi:hypothetical protein
MVAASLILSIIALIVGVVTLPTVFQMWFGRPRIETKVRHQEWSDQKRFICEIYNSYIDSKVLRTIGVSRDDVTISAGYEILEAGTNRTVVNQNRAMLYPLSDVGSKGLRIRLEDAFPAAFVCMIYTNGKLFVQLDNGEEKELSSGRYIVHVVIATKHEGDLLFRHGIIVDRNRETTQWIND